jgi:hypothetical protein
MPRTHEEIRNDFLERAISSEENTVYPGEPTLTGLVSALIEEVVSLRLPVEEAEEARGN